MTNNEAYNKLLTVVGPDELKALETLYKAAESKEASGVGKDTSYITYKQYLFLKALAEAGGMTLVEALKSEGVEQGDKPWHIEKTAGKRLIDKFIELGYRDLLAPRR